MTKLSLEELKKLIPDYVIEIAETLQEHDFEAYLVGGSVRDVLLGLIPNDYDVATNAYPDDLIEIFPKSIPTGAKFGTITVVGEDKNEENFDVEVTTYRSEADYIGGRWPTKVEFTKTIEEDLARRDFTINSMALNLQEFDTMDASSKPIDYVVDPYGGLKDLEKGVIKAVGDPTERFSEDGLRPMRACRLASQLQFEIEPKTFEGMKATNHVTKHVSVERMRDELVKLLMKSSKPSIGLDLMTESGIMKLVIPELLEGKGVTQPEFHVDDAYTHALSVVDEAEDSVKLAALFHDIAKPRTQIEDESGIHFYGHDQLGAELTAEIMRRLRFSNQEIERTSRLVRWHMFYYPSAEWRKEIKGKTDLRGLSKKELTKAIEDERKKSSMAGWSDAAIRRLIVRVGGEDAIDDLFKLRIADAAGNPKSEFNPEEIEVLAERVAKVREQDMAVKVTDLDISGTDLMSELKLEPGPVIGDILEHLLDQVIEDPLLNKKDVLLGLAEEWIKNK